MTTETSLSPQTDGGVWLPLVEYSLKSGVSLSTIRRKIKSNTIHFRLDRGKYLIFFESGARMESFLSAPTPSNHTSPRPAQPLLSQPPAPPPKMAPSPAQFTPSLSIASTHAATSSPPARYGEMDPAQLPLVERAVQMVSSAFESTVKEKDERIRLLETRNRDLEERVVELQLLVKVMEEKYSVEY